MRKLTSTNYQNEQALKYRCPLAETLGLISGRWKPAILWRMIHEKQTYGRLKSNLSGISDRVLARQLSELIAAGLVEKKILSSSPPRTEYELTECGESLKPLLIALSDWGAKNGVAAKKSLPAVRS